MAYKTQDVLNSKQSKNEFDTIIQQLGKYSKYTIPQNRMNALLNNIRVKSNTKKGLSLLKKAFKMKLTKQQKSQLVEYAVKLGNIATDYDTERALYNLAIENYSPAKSIAPKSAIIKLYISSYISQADNEKNNKEKIKLYETARKEARRYNNNMYLTITKKLADNCLSMSKNENSNVKMEYLSKAVELYVELHNTKKIYEILNPKNNYPITAIAHNNKLLTNIGSLIIDDIKRTKQEGLFMVKGKSLVRYLARIQNLTSENLFVEYEKYKKLGDDFKDLWLVLSESEQEYLKKEYKDKQDEKYYDYTTFSYSFFKGNLKTNLLTHTEAGERDAQRRQYELDNAKYNVSRAVKVRLFKWNVNKYIEQKEEGYNDPTIITWDSSKGKYIDFYTLFSNIKNSKKLTSKEKQAASNVIDVLKFQYSKIIEYDKKNKSYAIKWANKMNIFLTSLQDTDNIFKFTEKKNLEKYKKL